MVALPSPSILLEAILVPIPMRIRKSNRPASMVPKQDAKTNFKNCPIFYFFKTLF